MNRSVYGVFVSLLVAVVGMHGASVDLIDGAKKSGGWSFNNGGEFPGAVGSLEAATQLPQAAKQGLILTGDFSKGGQYVQMGCRLPGLEMTELIFWLRAPGTNGLTIRLGDGSGQTHQIRIKVKLTDNWQLIRLPIADFFSQMGRPDAPDMAWSYTSWGGAKDSHWHGPANGLYILLGRRDDNSRPHTVEIADVRAVRATPEKGKVITETIPMIENSNGWVYHDHGSKNGPLGTLTVSNDAEGDIMRLTADFSSGGIYTSAELALTAKVDRVQKVTMQMRSETVSSFTVLMSDAGGQAHQRKSLPLVADGQWHDITFEPLKIAGGEHWGGANDGRWHAPMRMFMVAITDYSAKESKTPTVEIRNVKAEIARTGPQAGPRIRLTSTADGNLFKPGDPVQIAATVEAAGTLPADQQLHWELRDYWGAEQSPPQTVPLKLENPPKSTYTAEIKIPAPLLTVGKYYQLHVRVDSEGVERTADYTGLAVLPEAPNNGLPNNAVPFTIRNWDDRIPQYIILARRLGFSTVGLWSDWAATPPYQASAPSLETAQKVGAGWVGRTPVFKIEGRQKDNEAYTAAALEEGAAKFAEQYKDAGLAFITMGNEPHGDLAQAKINAAAYAAVYKGIKKAAPDLIVLGTSVGPEADYFKAGFQNSQDCYDFHAYESHTEIDKVFATYARLFDQYGGRKPIVSTELGLNSQGLARRTVSLAMVKKFALFFANGGVLTSWFDINYPDREGKAVGEFGEAHNMFDSRYNAYNPKLDAITCYHVINAIGNKRFVERRRYADNTDSVLFATPEGECLQIIWNDDSRSDVQMPLNGVAECSVRAIDGDISTIKTTNGGISITISDAPLLLQYHADAPRLSEALGISTLTVASMPEQITTGGTVRIGLNGGTIPAGDIAVATPTGWSSSISGSGADMQCTLQAPVDTSARYGFIRIRFPAGELTFEIPVSRKIP